jgi:hypothetical protein
MVPKGT